MTCLSQTMQIGMLWLSPPTKAGKPRFQILKSPLCIPLQWYSEKEYLRHSAKRAIAKQKNLQCLWNIAFSEATFLQNSASFGTSDLPQVLVIQTGILRSITTHYNSTTDILIPKLMTDLRKIVICELRKENILVGFPDCLLLL